MLFFFVFALQQQRLLFFHVGNLCENSLHTEKSEKIDNTVFIDQGATV